MMPDAPPLGAHPVESALVEPAPVEPAPVDSALPGVPEPESQRWTRRELAAQVGVSLTSARKVWRALGFARVSDDDPVFTDADVAALARVVAPVRAGLIDEATAIALARALGQTTDRLVSWQVEALLQVFGSPAAALPVVAQLAGDLENLAGYTWRRHLAVTTAALARDPSGADWDCLSVGFADLVSYTRLAQELDPRDLGVMVRRYEALAADLITTGGGRLVKTVGDEVLFTAPGPGAAAVIALAMSEHVALDELVPDVRISFCHGPVLRSLGDVYGSTVNLASRLNALADPGRVVTDPQTAALLAEQSGLSLQRLAERHVRGFGVIAPVELRRASGGDDAVPRLALD